MAEEKKDENNSTAADQQGEAKATAPESASAPIGATADKPTLTPTEPTVLKPETAPTLATQSSPEPTTPDTEQIESIPEEPAVTESEPAEDESEVLPESKRKKKSKDPSTPLINQGRSGQATEEVKEEAKEVKTEPEKSVYAPAEASTDKKVEEVIVKEKVNTKPLAPMVKDKEDDIKIVAPPEAEPIVPVPSKAEAPFMVKFLKHLGILRGKANQKRQENIQARLDKIMVYAREKQKITNDEVERLTGVSDTQATRYLKKLVKEKKLVCFGKKKNVFYKPIK